MNIKKEIKKRISVELKKTEVLISCDTEKTAESLKISLEKILNNRLFLAGLMAKAKRVVKDKDEK